MVCEDNHILIGSNFKPLTLSLWSDFDHRQECDEKWVQTSTIAEVYETSRSQEIWIEGEEDVFDLEGLQDGQLVKRFPLHSNSWGNSIAWINEVHNFGKILKSWRICVKQNEKNQNVCLWKGFLNTCRMCDKKHVMTSKWTEKLVTLVLLKVFFVHYLKQRSAHKNHATLRQAKLPTFVQKNWYFPNYRFFVRFRGSLWLFFDAYASRKR